MMLFASIIGEKIQESKIFDCLLLLMVSLHVLIWFNFNSLFVVGDFMLPLNPLRYVSRVSSSWDPSIDGGLPLLFQPRTMWFAFFALFQSLGFSLVEAEAIYYILLTFLAGFSMYYVMLAIGKPRSSRIFSALIYMINPYVMIFVAQPVILLMYALVPLNLGLYINGLKSKDRLRSAFLLALAYSLLFMYLPNYSFAALIASLLIAYTLYYRLVKGKGLKWTYLIMTLGLIILINIWWILPLARFLLYSLTSAPLPVVEPYLWTHEHNQLLEVMRWLGHWAFYEGAWGKPYYPYANLYFSNFMVSLSFVPLILASLALLLKPKDRDVLFFAIMTVIFLFLAKGINQPFGEWYEWAIIAFPLLRVFRVPTHTFMAFVTLGYAFLIGTTLGAFYTKLSASKSLSHIGRQKARKRIITYLLALVLIMPLVGYPWPMLTGDVLINWYSPPNRGVRIPDYYQEVEAWLNKQDGNFRIFILPHVGTYMATSWGYQGANIYSFLFSKPQIIGSQTFYLTSGAYEVIKDVYDIFYGNSTRSLGGFLGLLNVKYVIVDTSVDTELYSLPSVNRNIKLLQAQYGIDPVVRFGDVFIFKNRFYKSLVYASTKLNVVEGSIGFPAGIGFQDEFEEGWSMSTGTLSHDGKVAYATLEVNGSYTFATITKSVLIDPKEYPYLLLRFKSNSYSNIVLQVMGQGKGEYLEAINPPPRSFSNHYTSTGWYTLVYRMSNKTISHIDTIMIHVTNIQNDKYVGKLELWLNQLAFAKSIGSTEDMMNVLESEGVEPVFALRHQNRNEESLLTHMQSQLNATHKPEISFQMQEPTKFVVTAKSEGPFILVLSESYDPGWKAHIDGKEVHIGNTSWLMASPTLGILTKPAHTQSP